MILGPLLFLIDINGVFDLTLSPNSNLIMYADDTFVFKPLSSFSDFALFQTDLNLISSHLTQPNVNICFSLTSTPTVLTYTPLY